MTPYEAERKRRLGEGIRFPNVDPCKNGHSLSNVNGWIKCTRCGMTLGKA